MKRISTLLVCILSFTFIQAQNNTEVSLFLRADSAKYLEEISSDDGDLYQKVGHHGPAVENEWAGFRIYFDHKCAIDVYSKAKPGLELREAKWYPDVEQQKSGWGADYYKVGSTVGLGGVRLWDGEKVLPLDPVTKRTAKVYKKKNTSCMEMISEGVPYKDRTVDIMIRVTATSGERNAKVEAFSLSGEELQFVTGINYHKGQELWKEEGLIAAWGLHPEDVAAELVKIGAAFIYDPDDYIKLKDDGKQFLLISKSTAHLETMISSASGREKELNSLEKFIEFLKK